MYIRKNKIQNNKGIPSSRKCEIAQERDGHRRHLAHIHSYQLHILPLAVADTALEPIISKRTLDIHHGKHHQKYVTVTNEMIKGTDLENASLEEIVMAAKGELYICT